MRLTVLASALVLALLPPAQAAEVDTWTIDQWRGVANTDADGNFSYCSVNASYKSGIELFFGIDKALNWSMAFGSANWNLRQGQQQAVRYRVDARPWIPGTAKAVSPTMVEVGLPDSAALFQQIQKGNELILEAGSDVLRFRLTSSGRALNSALECANLMRNRSARTEQAPPQTSSWGKGQAAAAPPSAWDKAATAPRQVTADERLEATQFVANMLSQAEMSGFRILTAKELANPQIPDFVRTYHVVWYGENTLGLLQIARTADVGTTEQAAASLIAADSKSCQGTYTSGVMPDQGQSGLKRIASRCEAPSGGFLINYDVVGINDSTIYNVATIAVSDDAPLAKVEDNTRKALVRVISR